MNSAAADKRQQAAVQVSDAVSFGVADRSLRSRVLELRRKVYEQELGHSGLDQFDERAYHLVACDKLGDVIAALRIIGPEQRPFDLEEHVDLTRILAADRIICEISRFWVQPDLRQMRNGNVHLGMLKLAYSFARKHGFSDLVTLALPHLRNLYRVAYFRPLHGAYEHPTWGEVHPMRLDLIGLEARYSDCDQPMARFLLATDLPNMVV